ncbi:HsdR family type I site-specific deoxyribonuclease [Thermococcus sp. GR5]|uniref:HsdR family type I site-specific deoxyribonuclease n=1 Tax=unclassified Thermococcus TaxID=2627626 RepID=UPI0014312DE2|nr:HsdR family type I site-specific deoxyribonuclease [Thermococcus sp. GR4]NJF22240.1 HsdR family type I site-specific deoxyribonuclease [Thermococcus sp. GR5]
MGEGRMPTPEERISEYPFINILSKELGWEYVPPSELKKERDYNSALLKDRLMRALLRINAGKITEEDAEQIIKKLEYLPHTIEGNREFLEILKNGLSFKPRGSKFHKTIWLIDYENLENNEFLVTRQFYIKEGENRRRPDIVLFINGIPVVVIEVKSPTTESETLEVAYHQIKDYESAVPKLFVFNQFNIISDWTEVLYAPTFSDAPLDMWGRWKDPYPYKLDVTYDEDPIRVTAYGMLSKENLIDIIRNFIFFRHEKNKLVKIMSRYMQFRATNKIHDRVLRTYLGEDNKKTGLIWHTQGSGKSLTMFFTAWKLYRTEELDNPTIVIVVDRDNLEQQMFETFQKHKFNVKRASSIPKLIEMLYNDERGIILTTVQKFQEPRESEDKERTRRYREMFEALKSGNHPINKRQNVIVLTDESHRSQYGILAINMRAMLSNAFIFGFTGTPIAKDERNTFEKFNPPGELYLDRYSIEESIKDGFTVPIYYQYKGVKYKVDKELADKLFESEFWMLDEETKKKLQKKVDRRLLLKLRKRIRLVAKDIAEHYQKYIEPLGFKGQVVAVNRWACAYYKEELDKYLPPEWSEVVFSPRDDDPPELEKYHKSREEIEEIVEKFRHGDTPKLLIVTNMLLTGFDAPVNQVMYLDKYLRDHNLLQAIARVNRPAPGKEFGLVIDYSGVFENLKEVLNFYQEDIKGVAYNYDSLKEGFKNLYNELVEFLGGIDQVNKNTLDYFVINYLRDPVKAKFFEEKYQQLAKLFEFISPDPFLAPYLDTYKKITAIYKAYVRKYKGKKGRKFREYYKKTEKIIEKSVEAKEIEDKFPVIKFDVDYLEKLSSKVEKGEANDSKLIDLTVVLKKWSERNKNKGPAYQKLSERIEKLIKRIYENAEKIQEFSKQLHELAQEVIEIEKEPMKYGLSSEEFLLMSFLHEKLGVDKQTARKYVLELKEELKDKMFSGWTTRESARAEVEQSVRLFLLVKLAERNLEPSELERTLDTIHHEFFELLVENFDEGWK